MANTKVGSNVKKMTDVRKGYKKIRAFEPGKTTIGIKMFL
jgi:hypothetical protein